MNNTRYMLCVKFIGFFKLLMFRKFFIVLVFIIWSVRQWMICFKIVEPERLQLMLKSKGVNILLIHFGEGFQPPNEKYITICNWGELGKSMQTHTPRVTNHTFFQASYDNNGCASLAEEKEETRTAKKTKSSSNQMVERYV